MICPNCQNKLSPDAVFCNCCGNKIIHSPAHGSVKESENKPPVIRLEPAIIQSRNILGLNEAFAGSLIASDSEIWFMLSYQALYAFMHIARFGITPYKKVRNWHYQLKDILDVRVSPNTINCSIKILSHDKIETEFIIGRKGKYLAVAEDFRKNLMARVATAR